MLNNNIIVSKTLRVEVARRGIEWICCFTGIRENWPEVQKSRTIRRTAWKENWRNVENLCAGKVSVLKSADLLISSDETKQISILMKFVWLNSSRYGKDSLEHLPSLAEPGWDWSSWSEGSYEHYSLKTSCPESSKPAVRTLKEKKTLFFFVSFQSCCIAINFEGKDSQYIMGKCYSNRNGIDRCIDNTGQ